MFSVHPPTIPGSGDRSEAIYPPGRNPFFFSSLLIRELCARSWSRPPAFCAEFRLEMLNWRTRDEENTRNEKKEHPLLSQRGEERDSSLSKTGRRAYDTRLWIRRKEVDYAPRVIATFNRNHHVRMKKIKEKKKKKKYIKFHGGRKSTGPHRNDEITIVHLASSLLVFLKEPIPILIDINFVQVCATL